MQTSQALEHARAFFLASETDDCADDGSEPYFCFLFCRAPIFFSACHVLSTVIAANTIVKVRHLCNLLRCHFHLRVLQGKLLV